MSLIHSNQECWHEVFRKQLMDHLNHYQDRVARSRQELPVECGPEDTADTANRIVYRETAMGNLERDLRTITEIERALVRIATGQYATCVACHAPIPEARLRAIPWTRTCIQCAGGARFIGFSLQLNPSRSSEAD
jgi:DnaK suppressor protein